MHLNNCYDLYKEKFGESIQEKLEETIRISQKESEEKALKFLEKYIIEPSKLSRAERDSENLEKEILNKIIKSKNWLIKSLNSPYIFLYVKYSDNIAKMSRQITWHWLSQTQESFQKNNHFEILKKELFNIGYNSMIYNLNNKLRETIEETGETVAWPKSQNLEIYLIKQLEEQLDNQKKLNEALKLHEDKYYKKQIEINRLLEQELDEKKEQLSLYRTELKLLKGPYFFHEDTLYKNYVFGDILPELKSVYNFFKEYNLYESNWGYFCYCLTWSNSLESISKNQKLELNIKKSDLTADDLGYILQLLKNHYLYESQLPFIKWVMTNIEIISGHDKKFNCEDDYIKFNEKSIRYYKSGKSRPNFYNEINQKLQSLL